MATYLVYLEDETSEESPAEAIVDCDNRESAVASAFQTAVDVLNDDLKRGDREIKLRVHVTDSCGATLVDISVIADARTF